MPSRPFPAWSTAWPASSSPFLTNWLTRSLSSTSRIFMAPTLSALRQQQRDIVEPAVAHDQQGHGLAPVAFGAPDLGRRRLGRGDRGVADADDEIADLQ